MLELTAFTTGYARLSRGRARLVLAAVAAALIAGVAVTLSPLSSSNLGPHPGETSDVELYRAEIERIHGGEGYYQAAADELTARGYPTRSVFNWRTPLPMWLLGKLPSPILGKVLLGAMAIALLLMAFEANSREATNEQRRGAMVVPVLCSLLLTGPLLPIVLGDLYVLPVLWAGVFIAVSAVAYRLDRPWLGLALGLAAVFLRELALPYAVLCAFIAWRQGRRRELAGWAIGLAAWAVFFAFHWWQVADFMAAGVRAHREGWIRFGGAGFVISTAQMNAYLLLLPQWLTAIYLVAALLGFAGWNSPLGTRVGLSVCLFLAVFAVVGHNFNQYWGCLIAPLLCFGVARAPASLVDLIKAARRKAAA